MFGILKQKLAWVRSKRARSSLILANIWVGSSLATLTWYAMQPPIFRMHTTPIALEMIKEREGLRLEAYRDIGGVWTIGYGHTGDVTKDMAITEREANRLFKRDITRIEKHVKQRLQVPVNENEFSALVMLAYNIGITAFDRSTVLAELNAENRKAAADAFRMWNMVRINGEHQVNAYLVKYREKERALFLGES